jgi:hypothetical protein
MMRSQGGRGARLTPVDDEPRARAITETGPGGRVEALFDQNLFRMHVNRERSSAFWMAASIWGVGGLVIGACLGAYMMFVAYTGMTPTVRDNLMAGAAMDSARETVNARPSLTHDAP